jgi:hypothetical protein
MRISSSFAALAAVALCLGLAACGGSSKSSSTTASAQAGPGGARGALFNNPKVTACLKKHGVTLPTGRGGFRGGGRGRFRGGTTGTNGAPPSTNGTVPRRPPGAGGRRFGPGGAGSAQFQKLRTAMQACGVNFGRPGGPGGGAPQGGSTVPQTAPATTAAPS